MRSEVTARQIHKRSITGKKIVHITNVMAAFFFMALAGLNGFLFVQI
jgi:hypothetical protein